MVNIDLIIISLFLIVTLIIGIYYGTGVKTFQDYAVGSRKLSTMVISLSMLATIYGGSMLSSRPHHYYKQGLYALLIDLASPLNFYIAYRFVIPRMKEFIGHLSVAESMGKLYGPIAAFCTAILGVMISIAGLTFQIKVGLNIITILFPEIEQFSIYPTVFLVTLVIVYASFGGARAVALTDVYQFLFFGLCFPILIFSLIYYAKDPITGWKKLSDMPMFNLQKICTWNTALICVLTHFIWRSVFPFDPVRIQRFYMTASLSQAQKVFKQTALNRIVVLLLFLSLAVALHIGDHNIPSNQNVLYYIVKLAYFPGLKGILVTTLIALLMSTADSCLHVASVLFAHDLWPTVGKWIKCNTLTTSSLAIARIASVGIGIMSLIMVLCTNNMVQLLTKTFSMYGTIVSVPFIMACFGFRPRPAVVLLSMAINTVSTIYRIYFSTPTMQSLSALEAVSTSGKNIFLSLVCSALMLVTLHYVLPKTAHTGWVGIPDRSLWDLQNQATKRWWRQRMQQLKHAFQAKLFPEKTTTFVLLGAYIIINTILALCLMQKEYLLPYIYGYMVLMAMGTLLMIYPAFHSYRKKEAGLLQNIWPWILFVLLFIAPLQWAKLGHYNPMVCALFVCSISVAIALLPVETVCLMLVCALGIHNAIPPYLSFKTLFFFDFSAISLEPVYAMVLMVAAMVAVITYRSLRDKAEAKLKIITLTRAYEQRISLESIYNQANWSRLDDTYSSQSLLEMSSSLHEPYYYLYTHGQEALGKNIGNFLNKLHKFGKVLLWKAQMEHGIELNQNKIERIAWEAVMLNVHGHIRDLDTEIQLLLRKNASITHILADPELFECLMLLNLWEISQSTQAVDHIVMVTITDTLLQYDYETEEASQSGPLRLPALAFWFSTETTLPQILPVYAVAAPKVTGMLPEKKLYQIESRQMVEAHGGYVEIKETEETTTCLYILPLEGKKVMRFKTYDPVYLASSKQAETVESVAQEKKLIDLLTAATPLTEEKITQTIAFIKKAHGLAMRQSGEPFYTHPMAVAEILLKETNDPVTILSGLLHDVVEDTPITLNQIELLYGTEIAEVVDVITHYNTNGYPWRLNENEKKKLLNQCKDIRVVQIKLADRLHNMRTLYARKPADQQRIAQETLIFYIPWGKKNKITNMWLEEMQALCTEILHKQKI